MRHFLTALAIFGLLSACVAKSADAAPMIDGQVITDGSSNDTLNDPWLSFSNPGTVGISSITVTLPAGYDFGTTNSPDAFLIGGANTAVYSPAGGPTVVDTSTSITVDFADFSPGLEALFGIDVDDVGLNSPVNTSELVDAGLLIAATFEDGSTFEGQFIVDTNPGDPIVGILQGQVTAVPEPASMAVWALMLSSGCGAVCYRRRKTARRC